MKPRRIDMRLERLSTYPQKERKSSKKKEKLLLLTVNFFQDGTLGTLCALHYALCSLRFAPSENIRSATSQVNQRLANSGSSSSEFMARLQNSAVVAVGALPFHKRAQQVGQRLLVTFWFPL